MMEDTYFHASPEVCCTEITDSGLFGGVFGHGCWGAITSRVGWKHVIVSPRPLTDFELNYVIEGAWEAAVVIARGDEDIAERIMSARCQQADESDGEAGWELQRLRGRLAAALGYTSVEMTDETGTSWLCLPGCSIAPATDND